MTDRPESNGPSEKKEFSDLSMTRVECPKCGATWIDGQHYWSCLLYTSPSPRDKRQSRMPSSA